MSKLIIDTKFFDKELSKQEIKPLKTTFENIGGICNQDNFDCTNIKEELDIKLFYNLPNELRAKILKHIFKTDSNCCAWSLHMMEENENIPVCKRSYRMFPRTYKLVYTMEDKTTDLVIKELLTNLQKELETQEVKHTEETKKPKVKKVKDSESKSDEKEAKKNKSVKKTKEQTDKTNETNETNETNKTDEKEPKKKKKTIPPSLKIKIWNKYIGDEIGKSKCLCCKLQDIYQASFSCGHIISEFNGGELKLDNLKPICTSCNSSMGTKNMDDYIKEFGF